MDDNKPVDENAAEIAELLADATDWEEQFHRLSAAIVKRGFIVEYDDKGRPVVRDKENPATP